MFIQSSAIFISGPLRRKKFQKYLRLQLFYYKTLFNIPIGNKLKSVLVGRIKIGCRRNNHLYLMVTNRIFEKPEKNC